LKKLICAVALPVLVAVPCFGESGEGAYLAEVAKKCQKNYFPPNDPKTTSTVAGKVTCRIECDGNVKDVRVVEAAKYANTKDAGALSEAALKEAVQKAAPFAKPPAALHCPAQIEVSFDEHGDATVKHEKTIAHAKSEK